MKSILAKIFRFLASYGFAVVLMLFLMVLTFLGTMGQVDRGLYAIQKEYFESVFLVHWFFGVIPVPLPGVFLLMTLFTINLFLGGIIRARKGWREWGMLVMHLGAVMLLVGCFITYQYSTRGSMLLREGESANHFESSTIWDLEAAKIRADGTREAGFVLKSEAFAELRHRRWLILPPLARINFETDSLPLTFSLFGYHENCVPSEDGQALTSKPVGASAEENIPGLALEIKDQSGQTARGVLWGMAEQPFRAQVAGTDWVFELKRRTYWLPFEVRLDKFIHEQHPGTSIAKAFISDVTRTEAGASQTARISMNEPMRHKGYAFYQASWGGGDTQSVYSVLSVVKNPADKFPQYACTVVAAGLFLHFCLRLITYLRKQNRERVS